MSYEPTKWQTGDIITLNKLNKLEQGVAAMMEEYEPTVWQIGDTVTSTKLNKLEQAVATLSENNSGSGGGSERVKLFNETVTTEDDGGWAKAILSFTGDITDDPLVVVFDGTEYELPRSEAEGLMGMGKLVTYGTPLTEDGPDFSTYPLAIKSGPNAGEWRVYTKTAGTYTVIAYTDGSGGGGAELGAGVGVFVAFSEPGTMPAASHVTVMNGDVVMMDFATDGYLEWYTPDEGGLIIPSGESLTTTIIFSDDAAASIDSVVSAKILDNASGTKTDYVVTYALSSDKKTLSVTIPAIPQSGFGLVVIFERRVQ